MFLEATTLSSTVFQKWNFGKQPKGRNQLKVKKRPKVKIDQSEHVVQQDVCCPDGRPLHKKKANDITISWC